MIAPHPHLLGCILIQAGTEEPNSEPRLIAQTTQSALSTLKALPLYEDCILISATNFYQLMAALPTDDGSMNLGLIRAARAKFGPAGLTRSPPSSTI